jgi:drug/metabolite transporter (DMT)-like permease
MAFVGLCNGTIAPLLLFTGLRMSTAVNASLFANMEPVFMLILAVFILHETFRRQHALSALTIIGGVLMISLRGFSENLHTNPGDALLILSSFCFAVGSIVFRKKLHHCQPHLVLFGRTVMAMSCFFLVSPFIEHPLISEIRAFPLAIVPVLLGFGFVSRFLNVFSFYEALDRLPVTTVSLMNNVAIITSVLFTWWVLHEPIEWYHLLGGALIVLGALLLEISGLHPTKTHLERHLRQRHGHR